MAYVLGPVKPHVKDAANYFGPKHKIGTIGGWRPYDPFPDHPSGRALDYMTRNKAQGDALVADVIANARAFNVDYIIWYRRIWQNGKWSNYTGSNPHTDHVHVTHFATPGTGNPSGGGTPATNVGFPLPGPVDDLVTAFKTINTTLEWLTKKENWARIIMFAVGFILAFLGIVRWDNTKAIAQTVTKGIKGAKP